MYPDPAATIRALLDAATADGPYAPRIVAQEVVLQLRRRDPKLLADYLDRQAVDVVVAALNSRDRSRRAHVRNRASKEEFGAAVDSYHYGNPAPLRRFLDMPLSVEGGLRKPLGDLTGPELRSAARSYQNHATRTLFMAAFLRALAKKVGSDTVADHYTEDDLAALWRGVRLR